MVQVIPYVLLAQKINENFQELYTTLGGDTTVPIVSLTGDGIVFEGSSPDDHETSLVAVEPTADNTVSLPNTSGTLVLDTMTQTLTNKTLTAPVLSSVQIDDTTGDHQYILGVSELAADRTATLYLYWVVMIRLYLQITLRLYLIKHYLLQ